MTNSYNWYQDVYLNIFNWYQFLNVFMFPFNWYQNVLHWHILIGILFDCTPLLILCFEQKGGEEYVFLCLSLSLFDVWQKGGEVYGFVFALCFQVCVLWLMIFIAIQIAFTCLIYSIIWGRVFTSLLSCDVAYMFCHHQKGGDCWPKRLHSPLV